MMFAAVAPLGRLLSAPREVLSILSLLRTIAANTKSMAEATRVLPDLHKDMRRVADTVGVLEPMDARMAAIENAMPVLVEVQKSLVRLPDTADHLDAELTRLTKLLDELHASLGPIARLAQRVPGGGNRGKTAD
jgi:hypothetical protein